MRNRKVHPEQQAVFWCDAHEEDRIFTEWRVFIGKIKSGQKKGEPRRLARINQNSALQKGLTEFLCLRQVSL